MFIEGSSETTLEISNYNTFNTYVISSIHPQFISWFIGFFEGDGSLYTSPKNYLEFKITQSSWDLEVLYMIKQNLGFGSVDIQDKNNSTYHFRVRNQKGILTLITIFNRYGNLFTEKKYERFKKWVDSYNLVYKAKVLMLVKNDKDATFQDGWLAGFTDSEGCFTVTILKRLLKSSTYYNQVQVRYILSQKQEFKLMSQIARLTGGKTHLLKKYNGINMVVNLTKLKPIIKYFSVHPLRSKKRFSFLKWLRVYFLVIKKKHLPSDSSDGKDILELIKLLKEGINQE